MQQPTSTIIEDLCDSRGATCRSKLYSIAVRPEQNCDDIEDLETELLRRRSEVFNEQ